MEKISWILTSANMLIFVDFYILQPTVDKDDSSFVIHQYSLIDIE